MRIEKHEKSRKWTDMLALIFSVPKQRYQSCKWMGEKRRGSEKNQRRRLRTATTQFPIGLKVRAVLIPKRKNKIKCGAVAGQAANRRRPCGRHVGLTGDGTAVNAGAHLPALLAPPTSFLHPSLLPRMTPPIIQAGVLPRASGAPRGPRPARSGRPLDKGRTVRRRPHLGKHGTGLYRVADWPCASKASSNSSNGRVRRGAHGRNNHACDPVRLR